MSRRELFKWARRLGFEPLEDRRLLSTITVNTLIDTNANDGLTTLREAIAAAISGDTIDFSVTGTIQLTNVGHVGEIVINKNLTINGPGANVLTIQAFAGTGAVGDGARIFNVNEGDFGTLKDVSISGLTLTGGDPAVGSNSGGAILTAENLTVTNCTISGNTALFGAGIAKVGSTGQLTVSASTISSNTARSTGGGIDSGGGSLLVSQSTVSGNTALAGSGAGGGIRCSNTVTTIDSSTISGNQALNAGGIFHFGVGILMTITNSTISGNSARVDGGGVAAFYGDVAIRHSTITGNRADSDSNGTGNGGGVHVSAMSANVTLDHTIVAGNLRQTSTRSDVFGVVTARYSLIGDNTGATITDNGGNQIGTGAAPIKPALGPLLNNGGPTLTHAFLAGSPALDAGDPMASAGVGNVPLNDQRGVPFVRLADGDGAGGSQIDIGAYEQQSTQAASLLVVDTLGDDNDGNTSPGDFSLREALGLANASTAPSTITFAAALTSGGPGTILLIHGELAIGESLTISGPGANLLTIDASGNDTSPNNNGSGSRIFNVNDGSSTSNEQIEIFGLQLTGGDDPFEGGAILNHESLVVSQCTISGNNAVLRGGGIRSVGTLTIIDSTISGNSASIFNVGTGGGISSGGTHLTVINSTISGNTSEYGGGGIYLVNSDFNNAIVRHSTITGNTVASDGQGGGVHAGYTLYPSSGITLDHTIVAGNIGGSSSIPSDFFGTAFSSFSFIGIGEEYLGPLADNGGPTKTHALLVGSPAIDAGDPAAVAGMGGVPLFDQRGDPFIRVFDGNSNGVARIDIGAYESQPHSVLGDYNLNGIVDEDDYTVWRDALGTSGLLPFAGADGSGNGTVGPEDYDIWKSHFGEVLPMPGTGSSGGGSIAVDQPQGIRATRTAGQVRHGESATSSGTKAVEDTETRRQGDKEIVVIAGVTTSYGRESTIRGLPSALRAANPSRDDALVAWLASRSSVGREPIGMIERPSDDSPADEFDGGLLERVDAVFQLVGGG